VPEDVPTVIDHAEQALETWRPGVTTRMIASLRHGTHQVTVFEQWCDAGLGAPPHVHAVEEVLTVWAGAADVRIGTLVHRVRAGQTVVIPAGVTHAFTNAGTETLHVQAILASPIFEAAYEDGRETSRRWG
jgi:mannose-6-phosphate isomerase-like protein (cupin superfamily)